MKEKKTHEKVLVVKDLMIKLNDGSIIVNNSSFDVYRGRVLGIIGESGSGKTLTCKAILKLLPKRIFETTGEVIFQGNNILNISEKKARNLRGKDISIIMQNPMTAFNPAFKIGDQIIETIRVHKKVSKKEAFLIGIEELKKMNLGNVKELMNSYPHALSGGMLQRIMIAISLMLKPSIIIADEATTALDVKTQAIILSEFKKMKAFNIGMIIVSHDFGVIAQMADDVIVMKDGNIIESGSVHDVFYMPQEEYTKKLLDSRLLNKRVSRCYK